jgi:hypothetical protein
VTDAQPTDISGPGSAPAPRVWVLLGRRYGDNAQAQALTAETGASGLVPSPGAGRLSQLFGCRCRCRLSRVGGWYKVANLRRWQRILRALPGHFLI